MLGVPGVAALMALAAGSFPAAQEIPATCGSIPVSTRDHYLHFTAWEDKDQVIRGRLKNTHPFEMARAAAIRFTFSLNPAGGGYQGTYCIVLGDIAPGAEASFEFVRPPAVATVSHVKQEPRALW